MEKLFHKELETLYATEEIKQLFFLAVEHIVGFKRTQIVTRKNEEIPDSDLEKLIIVLGQLKTGKPIQHILGYAHFFRNVFKVNAHTLIPRPETEELVQLIINDQKNNSGTSIIDIGTGSGCIPISLAYNMPQHDYWAIDISKEALDIARYNAEKLKTKIQYIEMDILEWDLVFQPEIKFDVIVSNPPYITESEKKDMHRNVLEFEPHTALFVENNTPLIFYDYIADFAKAHLNKDGYLYFEINQYLAKETADLIQKKGFKEVQIIKDINGADRIIKARH